MTRRSVRALSILAACLLAPVAPCLAQGGLPPAVVQAQNIGPEQQGQVEQYVAGPLKDLGSDDNDTVKDARNALLSPFRGQTGVSVAFRQAYSNACMARLRELSSGSRDQVAANAIRVLAELGTPESLDLLGKKLSDKKSDSVRLIAAASCSRIFDILNPANAGQPAVLPADVQTLIDRLGDTILNETNPETLEAAVRALIPGTNLARPSFESVRAYAIQVLCKQIIARSKTPAAWPAASQALPALLRGQESLRELLGQANPRMALSQDQTKQVVTVQGQMITWIAENLREIEAGPGREYAERAIRVGETASGVGLDALGVRFVVPKMADDFKAGTPEGDKKFFDKATQLRRLL